MRAFLFLIAVLAIFPASVSAGTKLGIDVTEPSSGDFDGSVQLARMAGASFTSLTLFWDDLEKNGVYAPKDDWPTIADAYFPAQNMGLIVVISVIDTVSDRRPPDLRQKSWADPVVAQRFNTFLGQVLKRMPHTNIIGLAIGNEVDGYLSGADWANFAIFFQHASAAAHRLRPALVVGTTQTWSGLRSTKAARDLAQLGDVWMVNYYPLDRQFQVLPNGDLSDTLQAIVAAAGGRKVYLTETGYPSGGCKASEAGQLEFLKTLLSTVDRLGRKMPLVNINWLHDISPGAVREYKRYYGVSSKCFANYLGTLGLRHYDGTDKPGFAWLKLR